jgi:hypothetical protein
MGNQRIDIHLRRHPRDDAERQLTNINIQIIGSAIHNPLANNVGPSSKSRYFQYFKKILIDRESVKAFITEKGAMSIWRPRKEKRPYKTSHRTFD